jgi:hypothetical protein
MKTTVIRGDCSAAQLFHFLLFTFAHTTSSAHKEPSNNLLTICPHIHDEWQT